MISEANGWSFFSSYSTKLSTKILTHYFVPITYLHRLSFGWYDSHDSVIVFLVKFHIFDVVKHVQKVSLRNKKIQLEETKQHYAIYCTVPQMGRSMIIKKER